MSVEFEDVSDLCAMVDAAKTTLQLPSTATNAEVYHKGFEVVLQHITTTFSHNTTKAQYLRLAVLQDINITEKENEATYHLAHRVGASYLMHGKVKRAETILLLALSGLNKLHGDATDVHPEVLKVCGMWYFDDRLREVGRLQKSHCHGVTRLESPRSTTGSQTSGNVEQCHQRGGIVASRR
jgi:hypothetical protein